MRYLTLLLILACIQVNRQKLVTTNNISNLDETVERLKELINQERKSGSDFHLKRASGLRTYITDSYNDVNIKCVTRKFKPGVCRKNYTKIEAGKLSTRNCRTKICRNNTRKYGQG